MLPKLQEKITKINSAGREDFTCYSILKEKKKIINIRETARLYDVARTTLQRRLNGIINRAEKQANCLNLTKEEEESLIRWILSLDQRGAAPRLSHVQDMANMLISNRGSSKTQPIGKNWVYNFIKRHD